MYHILLMQVYQAFQNLDHYAFEVVQLEMYLLVYQTLQVMFQILKD